MARGLAEGARGLSSEVIKAVYLAFADETRPSNLDRPPYRDSEEDRVLGQLVSIDLRELPNGVIGPYAGWAMTTVGRPAAYRYYLPRILQLAIEDPTWLGLEPPQLAWRIRESGWSGFSPEKREAVWRVFAHALATAVSAHPFDETSYLSWWIGAAALDWPVERGCEIIQSLHGHNVALQLTTSIVGEYPQLSEEGRLKAQFAEEYEDEAALNAIARFLLSDETEATIVKALGSASAGEISMILEPALTYIELIRSS